ncbi:hypothetical protein V2O64_23985 [Verrucomicrobiaceae bacterium 227]
MDHTRDNPLKRFNAFWIAILLVTTFGIGCLIVGPFTRTKVKTAYQEVSAERLAIKSDVLKAEAAALNTEALQEQMKSLAGTLNSVEPTPGSMIVPGSTSEAVEKAPATTEEVPAETTSEPTN